MADLLQSAASWMADQLSSHLSQTVTYRRGGQSVSLAATKCPVRSEIDTQFGVLRIGECDWIVKASLLVLSATTITPQKNDVVEESDGTQWLVLPLIEQQEYQPSDPYGYSFRIHTKRIEA